MRERQLQLPPEGIVVSRGPMRVTVDEDGKTRIKERYVVSGATFIVDAGRARLRTVTVGHTNGVMSAVDAGLEVGDHLIIHPADGVEDGSRVTPEQPRL